MKNSVNVLEKTLEKEKKEFIQNCEIFEVLSVIGIFALLLYAVTVIIDCIMGENMTALMYATNVSELVAVVASIVALKFATGIFGKLKAGDTPFKYDIADKIKGAGTALSVGGLICFAFKLIAEVILHERLAEVLIESSGLMIVGAILCLLYYVFNHGCKLQQENDDMV